MKLKEKKYLELSAKISAIISKAEELELMYYDELSEVHPQYRKSAANLVHYMALRSFDITGLQEELRFNGLPGLDNVEAHVMASLLTLKTVLNHLIGKPFYEHKKGTISIKKSNKILNANTRALFGYKSKKRRTRIMVTLPSTASEDKGFVNDLVGLGMNSARINCAHDNTETWEKMIENVKEASLIHHRQIKIMMDLGGPKLRTGPICPGPQVIHVRPEKDVYGKITGPAKVWLAPIEMPPPADISCTHIPINEDWLNFMKNEDKLYFEDTRGKKCEIEVEKRQKKDNGRWGICRSSAYIAPGLNFSLQKHKGEQNDLYEMGEMPPMEQFITLFTNDILYLHKDPRAGEPAKYDESGKLVEPAHISCTLPEVFADVKVGEPIMFDDGKIEGIIEEVSAEELKVRILHAKDTGAKLKSDKGINLPISDLNVSGLTAKDREDVKFVAHKADAVNFSFVNTKEDVKELADLLKELNSEIGIILKIETRKGFNNLPEILLHAMRNYPIGVMIARGDLAVETGWKNIATIQEEILRVCEAAHIPDIWATQVLESMAKKGTPSRAEITDAGAAQRAECVMLNKGYHIKKAIKLLDRILRKMQGFQKKKETVLSKLDEADRMNLNQDYS